MITLEIYYMVNDAIENSKFAVDINPVILKSYEVRTYSISSCPINDNEAALIITADGRTIFEGMQFLNTSHSSLKNHLKQNIILSVKTIDSNGNEKYHINLMSKLSWQLGFSFYPNDVSKKILNQEIYNTQQTLLKLCETESFLNEMNDSSVISDEDIEELKKLLDNDEFDIDNL